VRKLVLQEDLEALLPALESCARMLETWLSLRATEAQLAELREQFPSLGASAPPKPFVVSTPEVLAFDADVELTPVQLRYRRGRALKLARRSAAEALVALAWAETGTEARYQALIRCVVALQDYLVTAVTSQQLTTLLEAYPSFRDPLHFPSYRRFHR
jgi:hypothetical protein